MSSNTNRDFDPTFTCPCAPSDGVLHVKLNMPRDPEFELPILDDFMADEPAYRIKRTTEEQRYAQLNLDPTSLRNQLWPYLANRDKSIVGLQHAVTTEFVTLIDPQQLRPSIQGTSVQVLCVPSSLIALLIWTFDIIQECILITQDYNRSLVMDHADADRRMDTMIRSIEEKSKQLQLASYEQEHHPVMMQIWSQKMNQALVNFDPVGALRFAEEIVFDPVRAMDLVMAIKQASVTQDEMAEMDRMMRTYLVASHLEVVPEALRIAPHRIDLFFPDRHSRTMRINRLLRIWSWMCLYAHRLTTLTNHCQQVQSSLGATIDLLASVQAPWVPRLITVVRWFSTKPSLHNQPAFYFHQRIPSIMIIYERIVSLRQWIKDQWIINQDTMDQKANRMLDLIAHLHHTVRDVRDKTNRIASAPLHLDDFAVRESDPRMNESNVDLVVIDVVTHFVDTNEVPTAVPVPTDVVLGLVRMVVELLQFANIDLIALENDDSHDMIDQFYQLQDINNDRYPWLDDVGVGLMQVLAEKLERRYAVMINTPKLVKSRRITRRSNRE